jgi:hypothetical protein
MALELADLKFEDFWERLLEDDRKGVRRLTMRRIKEFFTKMVEAVVELRNLLRGIISTESLILRSIREASGLETGKFHVCL